MHLAVEVLARDSFHLGGARCAHNLSRTAQAAELDLSQFAGMVPEEMVGQTPFPRIGELPYLLTFGARGFYWFLLRSDAT